MSRKPEWSAGDASLPETCSKHKKRVQSGDGTLDNDYPNVRLQFGEKGNSAEKKISKNKHFARGTANGVPNQRKESKLKKL